MVAGAGTGGATQESDEYASSETAAPPQPEVEESYSSSYEGAVRPDSQVLSNKSLADFLSGDIKFYGRPINVEFRDAEIKDVLRFIADDTGVNLLVGDDVKGKITLKLRQ